MTITVHSEHDGAKARALQEALTACLPAWFAREASNRHYAEQAQMLPAWIALLDGRERGLLLLKRHGAASAEIYWMAVHPDCHRRGIGRAMLEAVYQVAVTEKRKLIFVCTVAPDDVDAHYRGTQLFYESQGFFLGLTQHGGEADAMAYYVRVIG